MGHMMVSSMAVGSDELMVELMVDSKEKSLVV